MQVGILPGNTPFGNLTLNDSTTKEFISTKLFVSELF